MPPIPISRPAARVAGFGFDLRGSGGGVGSDTAAITNEVPGNPVALSVVEVTDANACFVRLGPVRGVILCREFYRNAAGDPIVQDQNGNELNGPWTQIY